MLDRQSVAERHAAVAGEKDYYDVLTEFSGKDLPHHLLELTANLNAKTSALLTHVSIMIAATTALAFLPTKSNHNFIKGFLFIEIILYIGIAGMLLLAVDITSPSTFSSINVLPIDRMLMVVSRRRIIYKSMLYLTMVLTAGLAVVVFVKLLIQ